MHTHLCARGAIILGCLAVLAAAPRAANAQGIVNGIVRDSARGTPLADAVVELRTGATSRTTRSEQDGAFLLRNVVAGTHRLTLKRIGYRETTIEFHALDRDTTLVLTMVALPQTLDTMRAVARIAGIYGVVGAATNMRPLQNAVVQVLGAERSVTTDSVGKFFVELKRGGTYMVRVAHDGYAARLLSINVPKDRSVQTVPLLDSTLDRPNDRIWKEFDQRLQFAGAEAAVISGASVRKSETDFLVDAINFVPADERHGLQIGNTACVFVNGLPRPGWSVDQFQAEDIDAIELYGPRGDATGIINRLWPPGTPCARSIKSVPARSAASAAKYVVLWLKPE